MIGFTINIRKNIKFFSTKGDSRNNSGDFKNIPGSTMKLSLAVSLIGDLIYLGLIYDI